MNNTIVFYILHVSYIQFCCLGVEGKFISHFSNGIFAKHHFVFFYYTQIQ